MRARDFAKKINTYIVKIRLPQQGYSTILDTTVQARTPEMARRMIKAQYGNRTVLIGQPRQIKTH